MKSSYHYWSFWSYTVMFFDNLYNQVKIGNKKNLEKIKIIGI